MIAALNCAGLLLLATTAAGQTASSWENVKTIAPGTELRVAFLTGRPLQGTLESVTDSDLSLIQGTSPRSFPRSEIMGVSIRKRGHRVRNTLIGAGVGTAVGIGIGAGAGEAQSAGCREFLCGLALPVDTVVGGAIGLAAGTVLGLVLPTGGWRNIYRSPVLPASTAAKVP